MTRAQTTKVAPRSAAMIAASASGAPGVIPSQQMPNVPTAKQRRQNRSGADHKAWKDRVASLGCVLCALLGQPQNGKTDVHHIRTGQGMSRRASDFLAIPLCHAGCHQGPHGIHGDRSLLRLAKVEELDLLAITISKLLEQQ